MLAGWCAGLLKNIWRFSFLWYSDHTLPLHCGVTAARSVSVSTTMTFTCSGCVAPFAWQPQSSCSRYGTTGTRRSFDVASKTSSGHVSGG